VVTGVLFGLWPALRTSAGGELAPSLREDARGSAGGTGTANRARAALVMAEVALAVVLVVGAGLMLRSFQRLTNVDPGFRADGVLLVRMSIHFDDDSGDRAAMLRRRLETKERLLERVRAVPGVVGAGATKFAPFAGEGGEVVPFTVPGQPVPQPGAEPRVALQPASPGYLRTLGVPLVAGQDIDAAAGDSSNAVVAVINRRMAERFWPGRSPVGESFTAFGNTPVRVIGVAGDVRSTRLDSLPDYTAYLPDRTMPRSAMSIVVRTNGEPMRLAGPVRAAIREVLPGQAFQEVTPLRAKLSDAAATPRFFTVLVTIFGVLALALAAVGLYGVVSYVVRQREREMAVRMALGAPPARVLSLMLRQGMTPVAVGLTVGLVGAVVVTRVLRSLLFEVSATDPLTFAGVAALLGAIALLASYLPSRRATRVHPATILRAE
jgi:predicted permease